MKDTFKISIAAILTGWLLFLNVGCGNPEEFVPIADFKTLTISSAADESSRIPPGEPVGPQDGGTFNNPPHRKVTPLEPMDWNQPAHEEVISGDEVIPVPEKPGIAR